MKNSIKHHRAHFVSKLMAGTALAMLAATAAQAQNESVTVTGTTIRGQQPVGANVISVDRAAIEATGAMTTSQLLQTIPQLDNFGSASQGGQNSADGTGTQAPTIHSLGNSASNSTLILIDGHRLPLTGLNHNLVDPSVIPTAAIASVEVLPDGASAIYGSDAVAGVINFHTRKDYSGWETNVQAGVADHYNTFNFSQLFGHSWDGGGVVAAYNYSSRSNLMNRERSFITPRQDLRRGVITDLSLFGGMCAPPGVTTNCIAVPVTPPPAATAGQVSGLQTVAPNGQTVPYPSDGGNFMGFACPVATISTNTANTGSVFQYPYAGTTAIPRQTSLGNNGPGTGICSTNDVESALPSELRNQGIVSIRQTIDDRTSINVDLVYSSRLGSSRSSRGNGTNWVAYNPDGTGGPSFGSNQRNPFWVDVPGAPANANNQFISMSFDELLAGFPLATTKTGQTTAFATAGIDYDLGGDWLFSLGGTTGVDFSFSRNLNGLNTAEALLALNGTTSPTSINATSPGTSVYADPYGLGTVVRVTRALTMANALDVWAPVATNRTSPSVLRSLIDSDTNSTSFQHLQNITLHADGPLFDPFGGGMMKAAFGGEWIHYTQNQRNSTGNNSGPLSTSARTLNLDSKRTVFAAYAEFVVPVFNEESGIPLVRKLEFDFAGRYDNYNDFGDTKNPKISFNWDIIDGIRTSASFGTSFTAPALDSIGQPGTGVTGETNIGANNNGAANNLVVLFNDTRPFNDGAGIAGTFIAFNGSAATTGAQCAAAGYQPVKDAAGTNASAGFADAIGCKVQTNLNKGLTVGGGFAGLRPQLGQSYSANLVFDDFGKFVDILSGLSAHFTYYQAKFTGAITNIGIVTGPTAPGIPELTTFGPACGTGSTSLVPGAVGCIAGWDPSDAFIQALLPGRPLNNPLPSRILSIQDNRQKNAYNLWQNGLDFEIRYRVTTDNYGDFTFGLTGNQILRASQKNGPSGVVFDAKGGRNNGRFANIEFTGRASISWRMDPVTLGVSFSYQHPFNQSGVNTFPFNLPGPNRLAGYQHISALQVIDLNASYTLPEEWLAGTQINLNVNNILDTTPSYRNNTGGTQGGSIIGRTVTVGLRKKW